MGTGVFQESQDGASLDEGVDDLKKLDELIYRTHSYCS